MLLFSCLLLFPLLLWRSYRSGYGTLSATFLFQSYLLLIFIGAVGFYFTRGHYTFAFIFAGAIAAWVGAEAASIGRRTVHRSEALQIRCQLDPSSLRVPLKIVFLLLVSLAVYRIYRHGIELITHDWYDVTAQQYGTGLLDRLSLMIGGSGLGVVAVMYYALWRSTHSPSDRRHFIFTAACYLIVNVLGGAKSAAVMPLLLLGIAVFYAHRRLPVRCLMGGLAIGAALVILIGTVWVSIGGKSTIWSLYTDRVTRNASETFDFELYGGGFQKLFAPGVELGLETKRVLDQITGASRSPMFNEFIGNIYMGQPFFMVTGVSPELTLLGAGYANFGIAGALIYAFLSAFLAQRINLRLLRAKSIGWFSFTALVGFQFTFLEFMRAGAVVIDSEAYLLTVALPLLLTLGVFVSLRIITGLSFAYRSMRIADSAPYAG